MRRFLRDLGLFLLLQLGVYGTLVAVYYRPDPDSYFLASVLKHDLLRRQPSPRLLFVGGSNLAFGLDSEMVAEQTPYHPVNMGLFAGFPVDYLLREVEGDLRPGDAVVLVLEFDHFQAWASSLVSPRDLMLLLEARPANLRHYRWPQVKRMLDEGVGLYLGGVLRRAWGNLRGVEPEGAGVYVRGSFNERGDVTAHWDQEAEPYHVETWIDLPPDWASEPVIRELNAFHARCQRRGVQLFFAYPPLLRRTYADLFGATMGMAVVKAQSDMGLHQFHGVLDERLTIPVITDPDQVLFPAEDFFDSGYHLNRSGARRKTQLLIDCLRPWLGFP